MKYFTLSEFLKSDTATRLNIDNSPSNEVTANLTNLIEKVLDPARKQLDVAINVNSGYRCPQLNNAVGGAKKSYHLSGRAADVTTGNITQNKRLMNILSNLPHTELIWEQNGQWIHVAL